jgi:4-amino-4-deoxy-L-arabinose transferase-like glycosyltransferase
MTIRTSFTDKEKMFLLAICLLAFGLRVFQLDAQSIWFDESISVLFANLPFQASLQAMLEEGLHHTPLYYLLLRPFAALGFHEFLLRFVSVFFGVLAAPLVAQLGLAFGSRKAGLIGALLLSVNLFHTWYSQETRQYALLAFLAAGAMLFFVRFLKRPGRWRYLAGMVLFLGAGFNTHHFAFFVPLVQFVYLLLTFKRTYPLFRFWVLAQVLAGLTLLPWVIVVLDWGNFYMNSSAHPFGGAVELLNTFWSFSLGYTGRITLLVGVALALYAGLALLAVWRNAGRNRFGLILLWLLLPPLIAFVATLRLPMYLDRYLIVSFPAFVLLIGLALAQLPRQLGYPVLALLVTAAVVNLYQLYFYPAAPQQRTDWRSVAHYLEEHERSDDVMMMLYHQDMLPLRLYYHGEAELTPVIANRVQLPGQIDESSGRLWIIAAYSCENEPGMYPYAPVGAVERDPLKVMLRTWQEEHQNRLQETVDFDCVKLYLY